MEQGIWNLNTLWFTLIAVLWVGYFFLEGFDFGVGILLPFVSKDDADRRVVINSIGPVWDGNEVWLLVAGGATFAAFPEWYATLFSGFYLPLFLILVALIIRGVAFEYRGKDARPGWRNRWDWVIFIGSFVPALLWGVAFANIVRGVPIDAAHEYAGGFWNLLNPYALIGGLASLSLFTLHGALFLSLKTQGDVEDRARGVARNLGWISLVFMIAFLVWTYVGHASGEVVPVVGRQEARRVGVCVHGCHHCADRREHVHGALSERDAVEPQRGVQPHGVQRVGVSHDAEGDDDCCDHLHAYRAPLPGLDLLGV